MKRNERNQAEERGTGQGVDDRATRVVLEPGAPSRRATCESTEPPADLEEGIMSRNTEPTNGSGPGPDFAEYALLVSLIALVAIAGATLLGDQISRIVTAIAGIL